MHSDPAAAADAYGAYLPLAPLDVRVHPYPRFARRARSFEPVFRHGKDDDFFQVAQVTAQVGIKPFQVQHRVGYQLPGAMVGNVPATVGGVKTDVLGQPLRLSYQHMLFLTAFAQGVHRRVLHEN